MYFEKASRSTAKAPPASTLVASAAFIISESSFRISSFNSPTAFSIPAALNELLQINSANPSVLCALVIFIGLISYNFTLYPLLAS